MISNLASLTNWSEQLSAIFSLGYRGVMVSCSGGADSTALFHLLCHFSKCKKNFPLAVAHVNFGLRGEESNLDERFSEALAQTAGVPFNLLKVGPREIAQKPGKSVQEWARDVRKAALLDWSQSEKFAIAVAHHLDDVAETALLRLARGSGPGTLSGMRPWDDPFWRPLLREKKSALVAFLEKNRLPHRIDESNDRMDYDRNVIRHEVLPKLESLYPGAAERIAACAEEAAEVVRYAREFIVATAPPVRGAVERLRSLPEELAMISLTESLPKFTGPRPLSRRWLKSVLSAVKRCEPRFACVIPGGDTRLVIKGDDLAFEPLDRTRKPSREQQHRRSLKHVPWQPLLEAEASATMRVSLDGALLVAGEVQGVESTRPSGP